MNFSCIGAEVTVENPSPHDVIYNDILKKVSLCACVVLYVEMSFGVVCFFIFYELISTYS